VKLTHLQKALELTRPNDFQAVFDITSAYYHIKIVESQRKFLGAAYEDEHGQLQYIEYQVLPFGLASAVHCITKVFKPILAHLHSAGIRCSIFIDDGRVLATTQDEMRQNLEKTYNVLETQVGQLQKKNRIL